ncbi:TetR-like C-terminal domain-containing protein [Saccharopolyspora sp. CA-218241]|uniref:TetR-like C-terminal domain-containing protein n=1 Tax=Saccharopolyspora sp. CA-218241 TaxID=3240027 RepID=UPI003D973A61
MRRGVEDQTGHRPGAREAADVPAAGPHHHASTAEVRRYVADRLEREQPVFRRAVARGELAADVDPALLGDLLAGAAWLRVVFRHVPAGDDFVVRAVDTVLAGAANRG